MFNHFWLDSDHAPINDTYKRRILSVIDHALIAHPRTVAVRINLHIPFRRLQRYPMATFIETLRKRIEARYLIKLSEGKRIEPSQLHYAWVRQDPYPELPIPNVWFREPNMPPCYRMVIFVNKDSFNRLDGSYDEYEPGLDNFGKDGTELAYLIQYAWMSIFPSTFQSDPWENNELVDYPSDADYSPLYRLDLNSEDFRFNCRDLTSLLRSFMIERSESQGWEEPPFGCSVM